MARRPARWSVYPLAAFAAAAYFSIYWWRLYLGDMLPFDGNTVRLFYPSWAIGREMLRESGNLLWDSYRNMGQPFLADPQTQALYPIRLLSPFMDYQDYQRLFVAFHTGLAALPAYALAWRFHRDRAAAVLAAVAVGFNGFFLGHVTLPPHFAAIAWAPAAWLALSAGRPILLGVSLALQWLAGFPPFFILTYLFLLLQALSMDARKTALIRLGLGTGIMLGLAAAQWIPFLEMLRESARPALLANDMALKYSLHPLELARQAALPSFILTRLKPLTDSDPAMVSFYLSPIVWALAVWGLWRGGRDARVLAVIGLASSLLALGRYNLFYPFLPFITLFRFPAHWMFVAGLAITFASAAALARLRKESWRWLLVAGVAVDLLVYALPMHSPWSSPRMFSQRPAGVAGLESVPDGTRVLHSRAMAYHSFRWRMKTGEDWLFLRDTLAPSIGPGHGVREAANDEVLNSRRHTAFINRVYQSPLTSPLIDAARVSKIVTLSKEGNEKATPGRSDVGVVENTDYRAKAFSELNKPVKVLKERPGEVEVSAEGPGRVVVSEAFFPGWEVVVDGRRREVLTHEDFFLAVELPPGPHRVQFTYRPFSFWAGAAISLATTACLCLFWIFSGRRKRFRDAAISAVSPAATSP